VARFAQIDPSTKRFPAAVRQAVADDFGDGATEIGAAANAAFLTRIGQPASGVSDVDQNGEDGIVNLVKMSTAGYLFHLTTGVARAGAGVIGIGVDTEGSKGIIVSHKQGGHDNGSDVAASVGIYLDHQITINDLTNDATSYGFYGRQASVAAPLMVLDSYFGGSAPLLSIRGNVWGSGQVSVEQLLSDQSVAWRTMTDTGEVDFFKRVRFGGKTTSDRGIYMQDVLGEQQIRIYRDTGSGTFYPHRVATVVDELRIGIGVATATHDGTETINPIIRMKNTGSTMIGFLGAAPRPRVTFAAATGTKTRTAFATSTVTLPELAERVAALIDDLGATSGFGFLTA